ncbi:MAG TPA: hypothetical protein PLH37_02365 [bacterium]|nr:hypothetical protein [bacterium]
MRKTQTKEKQKIDQITKEEIVRWGIAAGVTQTVYLVLVVYLLQVSNGLARESLGAVSFGFILFLLFFVFSAVLSAIFVFGRPIFLLFEKKIQEAVLTLLTTTLTFLIILSLVTILSLVVSGI